MELPQAQEIAAQVWCQPETEHIPMNVALAEVFARELVKATTQHEDADADYASTPHPSAYYEDSGNY